MILKYSHELQELVLLFKNLLPENEVDPYSFKIASEAVKNTPDWMAEIIAQNQLIICSNEDYISLDQSVIDQLEILKH